MPSSSGNQWQLFRKEGLILVNFGDEKRVSPDQAYGRSKSHARTMFLDLTLKLKLQIHTTCVCYCLLNDLVVCFNSSIHFPNFPTVV